MTDTARVVKVNRAQIAAAKVLKELDRIAGRDTEPGIERIAEARILHTQAGDTLAPTDGASVEEAHRELEETRRKLEVYESPETLQQKLEEARRKLELHESPETLQQKLEEARQTLIAYEEAAQGIGPLESADVEEPAEQHTTGRSS